MGLHGVPAVPGSRMSAPTYGTPEPRAARDALLGELARTEAAVEWLREQVAQLEPEQLVRGTKYVRRTEKDGEIATTTEAGAARHELLQLYMEERRFLHALCRDALAIKESPAARLTSRMASGQ